MALTGGDHPAADDLTVHAKSPDKTVQATAMKFAGRMPDPFQGNDVLMITMLAGGHCKGNLEAVPGSGFRRDMFQDLGAQTTLTSQEGHCPGG